MADEGLRLSSDHREVTPDRPLTSPPHAEVAAFHENSDVDASMNAHHHTLGAGPAQAAPGDHTHDGGTSSPLWSGVSVGGTRGSAAYYAALEAALAQKGINFTATGP